MNNHFIAIFVGIILPLIGTSSGAAIVFFLKDNVSKSINKIFLGFAAGVMIAASVWSLIIPSIEMAEEQGIISWIPATIGIIFGTVFVPICDKFINYEKVHLKAGKKNFMLALAIIIHNIPEGMAVGAAFASCLYGNFESLYSAAFALSMGIAIQNFPEGTAISLPYRSSGMSKWKSFFLGVTSRYS